MDAWQNNQQKKLAMLTGEEKAGEEKERRKDCHD
jgi:hypothetical protein